MIFEIYEGNRLVNRIVASEDFVSAYCSENRYTYKIVSAKPPETEPDPTTDELLNILLGVTDDE